MDNNFVLLDDFIKKLQEFKETYGNVPVCIATTEDPPPVTPVVEVYALDVSPEEKEGLPEDYSETTLIITNFAFTDFEQWDPRGHRPTPEELE